MNCDLRNYKNSDIRKLMNTNFSLHLIVSVELDDSNLKEVFLILVHGQFFLVTSTFTRPQHLCEHMYIMPRDEASQCKPMHNNY